VVDEPDQPAGSLGELTYRRIAELARAQAAALDERGVGAGERVAIVSQNAARMLVSFFGVAGYGRILVPINFRLNRDEVAYIVEHSGASMLLIDPELEASLAGVDAKHRLVLGTATDAELYLEGREPEPPVLDEDATATINYTSGTTARPKGVQLTHRTVWHNAVTFGWHAAVTDRDVYLHTLPMFHCNGWGMPFATTACPRSCCARSTAPRSCAASSATASPCCAGRRPSSTPSSTPPPAGTARCPAGTACAWSSPARPRPRGRSSGWRPSSAGSSSRSTA
jgi:acyl-CoA synthetase (AMP-forming)/AMP-acid ligase II